MAQATDLTRRKEPATPKGFASKAEFLSDMRTRYDRANEVDTDNRIAAQEDIAFTYGEQWDSRVEASRKRKRKPVMKVNRLPAFVAQVVNNRLLNETEIRVLPEQDGKKDIAYVREAIIRAIFKNSQADFARDEAMKYQAICGIGWFTLDVDYCSSEVFEQEIKLKPVANPFSVVLDELSVEPSGGDAQRGWVVDNLPRDTFKERYPWASVTDFSTDFLSYKGGTQWFSDTAVMVVEYWRMVEDGTHTLVLMADGSTKAIEDETELSLLLASELVFRDPQGLPRTRVVPKVVARKYLCSGADVLEGPYDLPVSSLPIYRVPAWELRNGERTYRWGLVRFLKDPQRLYNFWRSFIAEQLVAAPRNKWLATAESVVGREKEWRNAHLSDDPLLVYNAEGGKPERASPPPTDAALITEASMAAQDMRDVSNIHEASLGMKSNEVSGKAIEARQAMTDLGTYLYQDRLRLAEERCAKNCNELIGTVYDSTRILTVLGPDDKSAQIVINDPMDPNSDVTLGRYSVTVTTGPATVTKRQLAARQMETFVNAAPETAALVMDLIAEAQDWPKSREFVQRFRANMPPGIIPDEELPPEVIQRRQAEQQAAGAAQELAQAREAAEIDNLVAEAEERRARAEQLRASAGKAVVEAEARAADVESKVGDRDFQARKSMVELAVNMENDNDDGE